MYLIFSRFGRSLLHWYLVHYRIVIVLTTNSSHECTKANSSLSHGNSPLKKSHPDSKENVDLHLLKFLKNNWNKVLHRWPLAYFAGKCDCTIDRFWRKLKTEATSHCSTAWPWCQILRPFPGQHVLFYCFTNIT